MVISVAKSTTAINLAAGLALEGYKVLLIDTDPQANSTSVFIHPSIEIELEKSLYSVIINFAPLTTIIRETSFSYFLKANVTNLIFAAYLSNRYYW